MLPGTGVENCRAILLSRVFFGSRVLLKPIPPARQNKRSTRKRDLCVCVREGGRTEKEFVLKVRSKRKAPRKRRTESDLYQRKGGAERGPRGWGE